VPAPVDFAVSKTVAPEADAVTDAAESAFKFDTSADAIEDVLVPEPLQLTVLLWPLTVIVLAPESYRVVYTTLAPPVSVPPELLLVNEALEKSAES